MARSLKLLLLAALLGAGCSAKGPTAEAPWVLVLAETPNHEAARRQAEELAKARPALKGASALTVRDSEGGLRHLVVSPPQASQEALKHLRAKLAGGKPLRLEQLDARAVEVVAEEQAFSVSPPEQVETLEQVARLLPAPGDQQLRSFLVLAKPSGDAGPRPRPPARSGRVAFSRGFSGLGWEATGEATYANSSGSGRVHWFVGYRGTAGGKEADALKHAYNFLLAYVHPEEVAEAAPELKRPIRKRRARRKARRKRRARAGPQPGPEEPAPAPVERELPPAITKSMPWGPAEVVVLERVGLRKPKPVTKAPERSRRRRSRKRKDKAPEAEPPERLLTAWLCSTPDKAAVVLILFDDAALLERVATPAELVTPSGLAYSSWVNGIWAGLPDVTLPGERFEYLAMQRLGAWLPAEQRRAGWAKPLLDKAVLMAGYRATGKGDARWQLNWLQTDAPEQAKALFEQGLVAPRQALMQRVLKAKRTVSYEVGITLRETGDVQAWHLVGASKGRLQELYFNRGRQVWIVRAGVEAHGGLSADDLQGRVDLLQIWDTPPS